MCELFRRIYGRVSQCRRDYLSDSSTVMQTPSDTMQPTTNISRILKTFNELPRTSRVMERLDLPSMAENGDEGRGGKPLLIFEQMDLPK